MTVLYHKLKEVAISVVPIMILVFILHFTFAPLAGTMLLRFVVGSVFIILGLAILFIGVDIGFMPFGSHMGASFVKSNKMLYIIFVGFVLGFIINYAEPDLHVLAIQVADALKNPQLKDVIRLVVACGTGITLMLGIVRIVKNLPMNITMLCIYGVAFILMIFAVPEMQAIAFDASGAATGIITVPLVLALSAGIASRKKDSLSAEQDSFGMVGMMASGAILGVLVLNLFTQSGAEIMSETADAAKSGTGFYYEAVRPFIDAAVGYGQGSSRIPGAFEKTFWGMLPVVVLLLIFQVISFRLKKNAFLRILIGFLYSFVGIVLFFIGVNAGFMEVGKEIGAALAKHGNELLVALGFLLGMLSVLTEPAVHVLTNQVEDITNGYVKRKVVLVTLSIGVAVAVGLSMLRIVVPGIMLWHYLVPGFAVIMGLTFFVPKIFVGMAFDSGSVTSGPMTATFVLSFARGAAEATHPGLSSQAIAAEAFGLIAMVAMTPLIAIQILGLIFKIKTKTKVT